MRLAVFDCDGTLVDGQAGICNAMEAAFDAAGLPIPDRNAVRRIVGLSLPQAIRMLAPDADEHAQKTAVTVYKDAYRTSRAERTLEEPLYDGIVPLLHALHNAGWLLAVATGKSDYGLQSCLAGHGLSDLFVSLQTADRHPSKPHPAMLEAAIFEAGAAAADAVMIGDTTFDMDMARAARVRGIGVSWGYHATDELKKSGAEAVADTMTQLQEILA